MSSAPRNGFLITSVFTLLTVAVMVAAAGPAHAADDCVLLGGNAAFLPGECRIDAAKIASNAAHGGPFTINAPLRITGTGSIIVPSAPGGNTLTLNIAGDLTIDPPTVAGGGRISGDVTTASGIGATISVEATGNILVNGSGTTGARITSNQTAGSCSGGRGGQHLTLRQRQHHHRVRFRDHIDLNLRAGRDHHRRRRLRHREGRGFVRQQCWARWTRLRQRGVHFGRGRHRPRDQPGKGPRGRSRALARRL